MPKMTQFPLSLPPPVQEISFESSARSQLHPLPTSPGSPQPSPPPSPAPCVRSPLITPSPAASLSLRPPPPCLSRSLFSLSSSPLSAASPLSITQKLVRLVPDCWRQASLQEKKKKKIKQKRKACKAKQPRHMNTHQTSPLSPRNALPSPCTAPYPGRHTRTRCNPNAAAPGCERARPAGERRRSKYQIYYLAAYQLFRAPARGKGGERRPWRRRFLPR